MASVTHSSLHLYHLTLKPPSAVRHAVVANFAGSTINNNQLILTATGSRITLYRIAEVSVENATQGTLEEIHSQDTFAVIRSLGTYKLAGSPKEYLIVAADTGRIATLEWMPEENRWQSNHLEAFGRSGVRRAVPGEYLAVDPRGRACMLASVEKNKVCYFLNRDGKGKLTISSPLEANNPRTLNFAVIALDSGYDNPAFATIEVDYTECDQDPTNKAKDEVEKEMAIYELDLGLNYVTRKWSDTVERTAHALYQVPGGKDGPGGVLVCGLGVITYRQIDQESYRVPIPRRNGPLEDPNRQRRIVAGVTPKAKGNFFLILQTDDGDLFRVTLEMEKGQDYMPTGEVAGLSISYFATIPVASVILLTKTAYLYCASECGEQRLYALIHLSDNVKTFTSDDFSQDMNEPLPAVYFDLLEDQGHIELQDIFDQHNPVTVSTLATMARGEPPAIVSGCGTGARSCLKLTTNGLKVDERSHGELGGAHGVPTGIWTTKLKQDDLYDAWVILTYQNSTLTLQINAESQSIEEAPASAARFLDRVQTLKVQLLANNNIAQIHSRGIRIIKANERSCDDWEAPSNRTVVAATSNERQVAIALSSGEIYYFDLEADGKLCELEFHPEMSGNVTALSLGKIPEGSLHCKFLAVGCADETVRILSCNRAGCLEQLSIQALTAPPTALQILEMEDVGNRTTLYLHIGLRTGIYIRCEIDERSGKVGNSHTRFLGPKGIDFALITVAGQEVLMAMGASTWIVYPDPLYKTLKVTPVDYSTVDHARRLSMENDTDGIVALSGAALCFIRIPSIATHLRTSSTRLQYTPRAIARVPDENLFVVLESDPDTVAPSIQRSVLARANKNKANVNGHTKRNVEEEDENGEAAMEMDDEDGKPGLEPEPEPTPTDNQINPRYPGTWASVISLVDPALRETVAQVELGDNEVALSCCFAPIASQDGQTFLIVGTALNLSVMPRRAEAGYLHLYRLDCSGEYNKRTGQPKNPHFEFIYKTEVSDPPLAMKGFRGRLLIAVGRHLCIYDPGMKQFLRKCWRPRATACNIVSIDSQKNRVIVADQKESVTYLMYDNKLNELLPFADDVCSRWSTCATMVDYQTVAGGDKFGNLFVVRTPKEVNDEVEQENGGLFLQHLKPYLSGTPRRLDMASHFFLNDIPMGIHKAQLQPGGQHILVWIGLQGTIGAAMPFAMTDDVEFFLTLERCMRLAEPAILGRDHLLYRSSYVPVKSCIDGDKIERFFLLNDGWKQRISNEVDKSIPDIEKKIVDMRMRSAF